MFPLLAKKVSLLHPCGMMHPFKIVFHLLLYLKSLVMTLTIANYWRYEGSSVMTVFHPRRESPIEGSVEKQTQKPHSTHLALQSLSSVIGFHVLFPHYFPWSKTSGGAQLVCDNLSSPQRRAPPPLSRALTRVGAGSRAAAQLLLLIPLLLLPPGPGCASAGRAAKR